MTGGIICLLLIYLYLIYTAKIKRNIAVVMKGSYGRFRSGIWSKKMKRSMSLTMKVGFGRILKWDLVGEVKEERGNGDESEFLSNLKVGFDRGR